MAQTLFNFYACLVVERWKEKVKDVGVGILLNYKLDEKLFRQYTRNAKQTSLTVGQCADDGALLATTHRGAEIAMTEFASRASDFGLNVNFVKTKVMATGREITVEDQPPLSVGSETIESVKEFPYLGSVVASSGRVDADIDRRIAQASRAIGALKRAVFQDNNLTSDNPHQTHSIQCLCTISVTVWIRELDSSP